MHYHPVTRLCKPASLDSDMMSRAVEQSDFVPERTPFPHGSVSDSHNVFSPHRVAGMWPPQGHVLAADMFSTPSLITFFSGNDGFRKSYSMKNVSLSSAIVSDFRSLAFRVSHTPCVITAVS